MDCTFCGPAAPESQGAEHRHLVDGKAACCVCYTTALAVLRRPLQAFGAVVDQVVGAMPTCPGGEPTRITVVIPPAQQEIEGILEAMALSSPAWVQSTRR